MDDDRRASFVLSVIRSVARTGSTNADLLEQARTDVTEGEWLRADRQTAGRGRQGRAWESPPGNFYASTLVCLRPGDPPAPTLGFVAAVALQETVTSLVAASLIKWPNDILLGNAKLSGILLERAGGAVVAGFGVNLAHHPELPDRRTTSLAAHGAAIEPGRFGELLAASFAAWLTRWRSGGFGPVRDRWIERAHPLGTALAVHLASGDAMEGAFDGLDSHGALILRLASGERRVIHAADVFLV